MSEEFRGVIVPLVTPLAAGGSVAGSDVATLIGTITPHVDALMPCLSTGEGWALPDDQWRDMVAHTVRYAGGLPVVAGILRPSTAEVSVLARDAAAVGARAVAVSTPFGPDVSAERMYRHYAELAETGSLPLVVYHESAVSGNTLDLDTLLRICRIPGVVAVKDSGGDAEFGRRLVQARPGVAVWQGMEHLPGNGMDGFAFGLANIEPQLCAELYRDESDETRSQVLAACERYQLLDDDWYLHIKARLCDSGIISTTRSLTQ